MFKSISLFLCSIIVVIVSASIPPAYLGNYFVAPPIAPTLPLPPTAPIVAIPSPATPSSNHPLSTIVPPPPPAPQPASPPAPASPIMYPPYYPPAYPYSYSYAPYYPYC